MARSPRTPLSLPVRQTSTKEAIGLDLKTLDESGKAPRTRLRDAKSAHSLFMKCLEGDRKSAHNRTILQEMADGAPPVKDSVLAQSGQGWVYNLNFLEADSRLAAALASYDDLADSAEHLITPQAYPEALPVDELTDALDVVAEEFSTLVREGTDFYSNWQRLGKEFVGHGVSFAYWPDADTYIWEPAGWDNALIPRKTRAKESAITVFITRHEYRANDLYKFIEDPAYAVGWNDKEVKKAIVSAAKGRRNIRRWMDHWPEIEIELKNNDLGFGVADAEVIPALHYWVKEFDGGYSFYVGLEDGTNEDYLYKDPNRYKEACNAFTAFTLGDGNGFYHSIRGALWKMFPFIQASNRFQNKMLTNTDVAMTLLVQGEEGDSYDDMQITLGPAIGYLPPSAKIVVRDLPDVGTQGMPIVHHLSQKLQEGSGQFQAPAPPNQPDAKGNPETKYGIQTRQQTQGSLTANSVNCFYRSMDKLMGEQFRRVQAIGPTGKKMGKNKDGEEQCCYPPVKEFFKRCKERGVKSSFITEGIRKVTAARAIGNGSPQMRLLALDELAQMAGSLDETGRDLAARDRIALRFGRAMADRYKPKVKRLAPDVTVALIENAALKGEEIPVLPDQNHNVHASIHVPKFQKEIEELVATRDQNPEADMRPMQGQLEYLGRLGQHAGQHVGAMAADPLHLADMKSYRAALEQGANLLQGFARELAQEERQAQAEGAKANPEQQKAQADNAFYQQKLAFEAQRNQQELQHKQETHALDMQLKSAQVAQVAQDMRLAQIKTDQEIAQQIKKNKVVAPTKSK